jgi:hypothetical protein
LLHLATPSDPVRVNKLKFDQKSDSGDQKIENRQKQNAAAQKGGKERNLHGTLSCPGAEIEIGRHAIFCGKSYTVLSLGEFKNS